MDTAQEMGVAKACGIRATVQGNGFGGWTPGPTQKAGHAEAEALRESARKVRVTVLLRPAFSDILQDGDKARQELVGPRTDKGNRESPEIRGQ